MNQTDRADPHALLMCFFQECESQFRFLEEKHGYLYLSGLAQYQNHYKIIKPYKDITAAPDVPFHAITRYERDNQAIEVYYGDKNYGLDIYVYPDSIRRLSLQDVIAAARKDTARAGNNAYLTDEKTIAQSVRWFAKAMKDNPRILEPGEKLIKRAETMRDVIMEQGIRAHLDSLVEKASVRAADAFLAKDYGLVIEILVPYEDHLNGSDLKKLKIARQKRI